MYLRHIHKLKQLKFNKANIGINLYDPGFGNVFLDTHQNFEQQKKKIDQMEFITIKNCCATKDTMKRVKRQFSEWEHLFANHISDKGILSRI